MSGGDPGSTTSPIGSSPLVAEDVVRLDLREAPTSAEAGLGGGRRDLILSRVGPSIDVELQLRGGTLAVDAFQVNIGGGPVGDPDPQYAGEVVVNARVADTAAVRELLTGQAAVLGLDPGRVQDWAATNPTPDRSGNRFFRSPSVEPSIEVEVRSDNDGWTLNYLFGFYQPPPGATGTPA